AAELVALHPPPSSPPPSLPLTDGLREDKPHPADAAGQQPAGDVDARALGAFLQGAGLPDRDIGSVDPGACLQRYGELLRELTSGIRELLAARALMKSEFRIPHTVIRPGGNNPLKFSVDLEQALQALLAPKSSGYAEPLAAVREAVADLRAH